MPLPAGILADRSRKRNPCEVTILFVPVSVALERLAAGWAEDSDEIILRRCPVCEKDSIIGHGRRRKQAYDEHHNWIRIRRGRCGNCGTTFTFLPVFSLPYTHYSLLARCQALLRRFVEHCPWERALPKLQDADRLPDPSTVRRWSSGLDCSQPVSSFLSQTVSRVAHWLERSHQADGDSSAVLEEAAAFYQQQLDRCPEALDYLHRRGVHDAALFRELGIGYAPGGTLRRYLTVQGHSFDELRRLGLINARGADALYQRIVFPLRQGEHIVNLYGRSIGSAFAHRFLPGRKGGLYAWEKVRNCSEVILVEGLFDYAALRQAGFSNVTCSLGTHLNDTQFGQLCEGQRVVYLTFDVDQNRSGQQAAEQLAQRLVVHGISARRVLLPEGHDPNSFFVQEGNAHQFQSLLEAAQP